MAHQWPVAVVIPGVVAQLLPDHSFGQTEERLLVHDHDHDQFVRNDFASSKFHFNDDRLLLFARSYSRHCQRVGRGCLPALDPVALFLQGLQTLRVAFDRYLLHIVLLRRIDFVVLVAIPRLAVLPRDPLEVAASLR